jgi:hypothetical protein
VRALLKDSQYDAAIAEARAARDAHRDDRSVREVTTPCKHQHSAASLPDDAHQWVTCCSPSLPQQQHEWGQWLWAAKMSLSWDVQVLHEAEKAKKMAGVGCR